jgi:hypothetical protein
MSDLQDLDPLVGEWDVEIPGVADGPVGWTTWEWMDGGGFLVQRWGSEPPEFPNGIALIGPDADGGDFLQHYFDSRGVHRVYVMSLDAGVLRWWREDPDFHQRYEGAFTDDGRTLEGTWHKAMDGVTWEKDFDLTYRRR